MVDPIYGRYDIYGLILWKIIASMKKYSKHEKKHNQKKSTCLHVIKHGDIILQPRKHTCIHYPPLTT